MGRLIGYEEERVKVYGDLDVPSNCEVFQVFGEDYCFDI